MKLFFSVLLFVISALSILISEEDKVKIGLKPSLNVTYETLFQSNLKNFDIDFGLYKSEEGQVLEYKKNDFFKKSDENICLNSYFNLLRFGVNFKSEDFIKVKNHFNFSLINSFFYANRWSSKTLHCYNINLLNLKSNLLFDDNTEWFDLSYGYGYDYLNKLENHLLLLLRLGFSYNSYKLDDKIFENYESKPDDEYSSLQINFKADAKYSINSINANLSLVYNKLTLGDLKSILALKTKILYSFQSKKQLELIDSKWEVLQKDFELFLLFDYYKFAINDRFKEAYQLSLGFNYQINCLMSEIF
ncbi:MAG TPA: hypothetical protein PKY56_04715 [Candidatus Kapabacteria bacterium]|nr:hypothetical protein [Candidatus Kapabacteria bacterium]HPO63082.1 hypothetical protein [Candidatus Kapabacteria bacterium]